MASASPLKDIDEQFLQCLICLDRLKEPKLLPCLHRYCTDCLKKVVKKKDKKVQCPTCRRKHDLPEEGVDGLKTDFNTKNIVEFIELQDSVKHEPEKVCIHCSEKQKAAAFCFKCNDFLCKKCHEHHLNNKVMTDHQPHIFALNEAEARNLTIEKLSSLRQAPRCHDHPEKLSELCCTSCGNLPICVPCTYGRHQGHNLKEVKTLCEVERAKLTGKIQNLMTHKNKIYQRQEEIRNTKEKLMKTTEEERNKLQERLDDEEKKQKSVIHDVDESLKQQQKELEETLKRKISQKNQELEREIAEARARYDKVCEEERRAADVELQTLQEDCERDKIKLQEGLDNFNREITELLTSLKTQEEENTKKINELSDHLQDIVKRFENVTAISSSILAAKHPWTDVQCIPDICEAADCVLAEMEQELPELKILSDIIQPSDSRGVRVKVGIAEKDALDVKGVWFITDITCSDNGKIIITGSTYQGQLFIKVITMGGEHLRHDIINTSPSFSSCYCDTLSQFKIATACEDNEIGIYDIRDGAYRSAYITNVSRWPKGQRITCVAADTVHKHILIGGRESRDVYVFSDQLKYIHTLVIPQMIKNPSHMTFHQGNLLICDSHVKKAWAVTIGGKEAKEVFEFTMPKLDGGDWHPRSVCTDRNHFIYMLWWRSGHCLLVQYSRDGLELLSTTKVDSDAFWIKTTEGDGAEKMLVATIQKIDTYRVIVKQ